MRTIISSKYRVLGYNSDETNLVPRGWMLEEKVTSGKQPARLIVSEFKYVGPSYVHFYKKDGTVEDHTRSMIFESLS